MQRTCAGREAGQGQLTAAHLAGRERLALPLSLARHPFEQRARHRQPHLVRRRRAHQLARARAQQWRRHLVRGQQQRWRLVGGGRAALAAARAAAARTAIACAACAAAAARAALATLAALATARRAALGARKGPSWGPAPGLELSLWFGVEVRLG